MIPSRSSARIGTRTTATNTDVVIDASAVVRALVDRDPEAVEWLARISKEEVTAACPDLLYAEVANALIGQQRAGKLTSAEAKRVIEATVAAPFESKRTESIATAAWVIAVERGLSAYDACYVVLAETMHATLLTADRRLAAATAKAVLITA